jgi:hypothetical protein
MHPMICSAAMRVHTYLGRKTCVGASGGQPGNGAKERRSMDVDYPCGCRTFSWSEARHEACQRRVAAERATRFSGGGLHDLPQPEMSGTEGFG